MQAWPKANEEVAGYFAFMRLSETDLKKPYS